ncbi:copper amine oxidase N-terminal domain-containing protein [Paenibacillus sp. SYP-B4298]|uniref:copper amine oxidase N-terminal domain-containing protein n=1 Tax=Paenibacillus sp. SYP-B4298 TaxID=2996034 RepID=UPI0022DD2CB6|nr:copper amine oxidase N-terminal domain-containing protein [Paenibacillus sp. SYP-B4298]
MIKRKASKRSLVALMLSAVLLIAAGCQAVGGLDFNTVLKQAMKVSSSEGSQSLEFEMLYNEEALKLLEPEERSMLELFSKVKLDFQDIKVSENQAMSMNGTLSLGGRQVNFSLHSDDKLAVLNIEGAWRPFVIDLNEVGSLTPVSAFMEGAGLGADQSAEATEESRAKLTELSRQMVDVVGGYAIDNMPNPNRITVAPEELAVNGEQLKTAHVQMEIDGSELIPWASRFVNALIADKAGLEKMLTELIRLFRAQDPQLWTSLGIDNPLSEESTGGKSDKELVAEGVEGALEMLGDLKRNLDSVASEEQSVDSFLNKESYLKANLYVDSKLDIRQSVVELAIRVPQQAQKVELEDGTEMQYYNSPVEGFHIKVTQQAWNVNGKVVPEAVQAPKVSYTFDELVDSEGYAAMRLFKKDSVVRSLMNELKMNEQSAFFGFYDYNPPIMLPEGITLLPLRDTLNQLDSSLSYDNETKVFTVFDRWSEDRLSFKIGEDTFVSNGETKSWSVSPIVVEGTLYVPARDLIKALSGSLHWEDWGDEWRSLTVERKL